MGKTGGGRGTNQYKVRGLSVQGGSVSPARHHNEPDDIPLLSRKVLDKREIERYLGELAISLSTAGIKARIVLVGGAALSFYYNRGLTPWA